MESQGQSLLRQLARERQARTGELEVHQRELAESAELQRINARFNKVSTKLTKELTSSINNLKKFQEECIKKNIQPELNKIKIATALLQTGSAAEITQSLSNMRTTINNIAKYRKECLEETQENYELYADVDAQEQVLQELLPEKYLEVQPTLQTLKQQLSTTLDTSLAEINQTFETAKAAVFNFFAQLNTIGSMRQDLVFNILEFTKNYNLLKATYEKVFGEQLLWDLGAWSNV